MFRKLTFLLLTCGSLFLSGYSYATVQPCNTCPEVVLPEVSYNEIANAVLQGNYQYATDLIEDYVLQELRKTLNDEKRMATFVAQLQALIEPILSDNTKTEQQKAESITAMIEAAMEPYGSVKTGSLRLEFAHSIEFGATRLTWDKKIEVDQCRTWMTYCNNSGCWSEYYIDYVRKVPDYYLYRIVDGQEKLITKFKGHRDVQRNSITFSGDIYETLKDAVNFDYDGLGIDSNRAIFYDVRSDLRMVGSTLQYRVVSDDGPYRLGKCGSSRRHDTTASFDQDGDGQADFIPDSVYAEHWGRVNAWLIPVITLTLQ